MSRQWIGLVSGKCRGCGRQFGELTEYNRLCDDCNAAERGSIDVMALLVWLGILTYASAAFWFIWWAVGH